MPSTSLPSPVSIPGPIPTHTTTTIPIPLSLSSVLPPPIRSKRMKTLLVNKFVKDNS
eukprot:CAMPEP_0170819278 /NCGR_PEP_ID=MMETSP0733-20121128/41398_1 /TAXON_ID=186038 /ORGANISM="Fragilariopsis kerguelensis, Strain L26-C5" /LENGTH=56 /DNA_ID=CAMNT_0011179875 /DNA_START=34 /DNA_END=200 /DNA_ORIENTATION=+